jgi:hypothetical protein
MVLTNWLLKLSLRTRMTSKTMTKSSRNLRPRKKLRKESLPPLKKMAKNYL